MRSSKSRSRGNKNRNNRPSGGNIVNRVFDSSGPDGKVRGTPQQIIEKYTQLHRDAQLAGDRVAAENFAQHAEHYLRMLAEAQKEIDKQREDQEEQNRQRQAERDRERAQRLKAQEDASGGDDEGSDSGLVETPEARAEQSGDRGQSDRADRGQNDRNDRNDRGQSDRRDRGQGDRSEPGDDRGDRSQGQKDEGGAPDQAAQSSDEAPRKPRRPRRPRNKSSDDGSGDGPQQGNPAEAAE